MTPPSSPGRRSTWTAVGSVASAANGARILPPSVGLPQWSWQIVTVRPQLFESGLRSALMLRVAISSWQSLVRATRTTVRRLTKIDQFTNFIRPLDRSEIGNRRFVTHRGLPLSARDLLEPPQGLDVPVEIRNAVHGI